MYHTEAYTLLERLLLLILLYTHGFLIFQSENRNTVCVVECLIFLLSILKEDCVIEIAGPREAFLWWGWRTWYAVVDAFKINSLPTSKDFDGTCGRCCWKTFRETHYSTLPPHVVQKSKYSPISTYSVAIARTRKWFKNSGRESQMISIYKNFSSHKLIRNGFFVNPDSVSHLYTVMSVPANGNR